MTTALFYDPDGHETRYTSERNADSDTALSVGRTAGVFPASGRPNIVDHVEVKAAAAMRKASVPRGDGHQQSGWAVRRHTMTGILDGRLRRVDLIHGDQQLVPTVALDLRHTHIAMTSRDVEGIAFLLDTVLTPEVGPATVSMHLTPRDHQPQVPPEFPPSNLYFGIDPPHNVAAVAPDVDSGGFIGSG